MGPGRLAGLIDPPTNGNRFQKRTWMFVFVFKLFPDAPIFSPFLSVEFLFDSSVTLFKEFLVAILTIISSGTSTGILLSELSVGISK